MSRILIVEDEEELSLSLKEWLEGELYAVSTVNEGKAALEMLLSNRYDLIILDWMLPGLSGLEICKVFRESGGDTPILILTARNTISAKEEGLNSGADDYLTKPFNLRELSARVRALLRRPQSAPQSILKAGNIVLDRNSRTVSKDGAPVKLLPKEFILLEVLILNRGKVLSSDELTNLVWGVDSDITPDTVRSHIRSLRKKVDNSSNFSVVKTVHSMGYKVESD
ncbi:MAG: response regulator transcription factor [Cyanobacteria bacterium TGS_CYA1]|nr:response regulator transcription factor [Cyanobacteria bacterium TGS_CYA1]